MSTRLARSAGLIGAATLTSRVLGVAREIVLAALFGAGNQMDAFNVAFRIPNLLRDLFAEGAMSAAFVPAFTRQLSSASREEAWKLGRKGVDDSLLLVIAKNDRKLHIEVGYGLEGVVPDAVAKRVIEDDIVPRFKQGDFYGGIRAGMDRLMRLVVSRKRHGEIAAML